MEPRRRVHVHREPPLLTVLRQQARGGDQATNQPIGMVDRRTRSATDERERIDQREREQRTPGAYPEEGVPEEVERHRRADEEEEGDLGWPGGGRRRVGRDAQERLGAEQHREEEQEGQRRGEAQAEARPRAAARCRRERRHRPRPFHRHRRAAAAVEGWSPGLLLGGGLRGIYFRM